MVAIAFPELHACFTLSSPATVQGTKSMDVDSPKVIPGTPNVDDFASLGDDDDDLSRRTTPAFFELEESIVEEEDGERNGDASSSRNGVQQQQRGSDKAAHEVPAIAYEMDLDNNDDEENVEVQQHFTAHRLVRNSSIQSHSIRKATLKLSFTGESSLQLVQR